MRPRKNLPLLLLMSLFAALTVPMACMDRIGTSEANDQNRFHWPTILAMSEDWPSVSLEDYRTATGPLYHAALAGAVVLLGAEMMPIRVINALLSLPLVVLSFMLIRRIAPAWGAAAMALPFVVSSYTLSSAIWITTDNISIAFLLSALLAATAASSTGATVRAAILSSVSSMCAAAIRQIHVWVCAPCALAHLLRRRRQGASVPRALVEAALIGLPACTVVGVLWWWWGGLTPPYVEARNAPVGNPFAFGFAMSMVGVFSVFYLPIVQPWRDRMLWRGVALPLVMLLAVALTVLTPTTLSKAEGRWGGAIWALADALPVVMERSLLFPPLALLGGVFLLAAGRRAASFGRWREALVALIAIVCFTLAHAVQPWCSQRYNEPVLLLMVMWLASLCINPADANPNNNKGHTPLALWCGPLCLGLLQLGLSIYAVYWQTRAADISP